ncbi:MAG: methyltransferase domain-containing protein [bacterium]|nr:methyltransferase domain-containing protein [bacterium]
MDSYNCFAEYYDELTENVSYGKRCDYILKLLKRHNHPLGLTLDLACGTGSLTLELAKKGVDVFGADASEEMLCTAQSKAYEQGFNILFICQQMQCLQLAEKIDTCLCTLDSINHLTEKEQVQSTFNRVSEYMEKGGVFLFDVNTPYKHRQILGNNTFVYETDDVFCVWQNTLCDGDVVEIDLDFFEYQDNGTYIRNGESFCERAYTHEELAQMLKKAGFIIAGVYGDMTEETPGETEERVFYVAVKA